jgi:hypothetical protein
MSQNEMILSDLQKGKKITALEALTDYQCFRLASRINDLKNLGHDIKKNMVSTNTNKEIAQYYIEKE